MAEEKIRAAETRAQLAQDEARAEARQAADKAEVDALELQLIEQEEHGSQQEPDQGRDQTGISSCLEQEQHGDKIGTGGCLKPPDHPRDSRERTRDWLETNQIQPDSRPVADLIPTPSPVSGCSSLPKVKLEMFDGSPLKWPKWISLFRVLVHNNRSLTDTERMIHLQSSLTGNACEVVRGLLCDGSLYELALNELETQFGNPVAVVQSTLSSVLQHPAVKHDIAGLASLSRVLHTAVCVLMSMGYRADLAATSNMQQVMAKLPSALAWQWGQVEVEMMPRVPNLEDIDAWLRKIVLAGRRTLSAAHTVERGTPATTRTV